MQEIRFPMYGECLNRVIDWNAVVGQRDIELQRSLVISEIEETRDAIKDRDDREILDGVCDVFVTASYLNYMLFPYALTADTRIDECHPLDVHTLLKCVEAFSSNSVPHHFDIQLLLIWAVKQYGLSAVESYMLRVLDSNDSKFVPSVMWDEERELAHAREKYGNKFGNIAVVVRELNKETVYLLRGNDGEGKLLKPTTFVEP
jgi:hypothetical protein